MLGHFSKTEISTSSLLPPSLSCAARSPPPQTSVAGRALPPPPPLTSRERPSRNRGLRREAPAEGEGASCGRRGWRRAVVGVGAAGGGGGGGEESRWEGGLQQKEERAKMVKEGKRSRLVGLSDERGQLIYVEAGKDERRGKELLRTDTQRLKRKTGKKLHRASGKAEHPLSHWLPLQDSFLCNVADRSWSLCHASKAP